MVESNLGFTRTITGQESMLRLWQHVFAVSLVVLLAGSGRRMPCAKILCLSVSTVGLPFECEAII